MHLTGMGVPRSIFLILTLISSRQLSVASENSTVAPAKKTHQESPKKGVGKLEGAVVIQNSYEYHERDHQEESDEDDEKEEDMEYVEALSTAGESVLLAAMALPYLWILVYMFNLCAFLGL